MIGPFTGKYRFLSNFYLAKVSWGGVVYPSLEHAYQAAKTLSTLEREKIRKLTSPGAAKRIGATLTLRPHWDEDKLLVMEILVGRKFSVHPLDQMLLATVPHELVEINAWGDTFWGVSNGVGENHLGRTLMKVRDEIVARVHKTETETGTGTNT